MTHWPPSDDHLRSDSADHWLAYRYLAGELTDEEAAACEMRLADDLSLQTALAECVLLEGRLNALMRSPSGSGTARGAVRGSQSRPDSRGPRNAGSCRPRNAGSCRPRNGWALIAALCLVSVGLLWTAAAVTPPQTLSGGAANGAVLNSASVVAMWSALDVTKVFPAESRETLLKLDLLDEEPDLEIPDWLLAAVLAETAEDEAPGTLQEHQL